MASTARSCGLFFRLLFVIVFAHSYDTEINLALNKNATQFSLNPSPGGLWSAGNAVDGNKACVSVDGSHFTFSGRGNPPWWQVDLSLIYIINRIKVYGRTNSNPEQLQGFVIKFSNTGIMENQFTLPFNQTPDTNSYPPEGIFDIRFSASQARYVRLILERTRIIPAFWQIYPIVICEVEVFGPNGRTSDIIQAVRGNVTVTMGRAVTYGPLTFPKDNAIDNSPRTDPDLCNCCSSTDEGWWMIDLGKKYLIQAIQIIGRSDGSFYQNKPFTVSVGEMAMNLTEIYSGNPNQGNHTYFIPLNHAKVIQVVNVWKKQSAILTVCEFKVYGLECIDGHFGKGCQSKGFCNGTYDMATGECPSCLAGYKGNTCSKACDNGFFHIVSMHVKIARLDQHAMRKQGFAQKDVTMGLEVFIATKNVWMTPMAKIVGATAAGTGDICSNKNGLCPNGCVPGYNFTGDRLCLTECIHGTYGLNCAENCGHCRDRMYCNTHNGNCMSGCERGYRGVKCKDGCPNGLYGYDCAFSCHCKSESDICDPEYGSCFNGCGIGWGGQNCSSDLSIIKHDNHLVNAVQKSTYDLCNASNTYNGKILMHPTSNDTLLCQVCSVTREATDPWLQIDLGRMVSVGYIRVHGRGNQQSSNLLISASNVSLLTSDSPASIANITKASISGTILELPLPRTFQYLVIRKHGVSVMSICEVGLYGKECAAAGSFGDRCRRSCNCKDGKKCDILTGKCSSPGCVNGWRGAACDISCSHSKFGLDCSRTCHCFASGECDRYNGTCKAKKCEPGWRTLSCDVECEDGWFGDNCNMPCGVCMNGAVCDKVSGNCSGGCVRGRLGNQCISDEKQVEITKTGEGNTAVAVLATLLAVAIIGNVVLLTLYCRRKKETRKEKEDDQNHYTVPGASLPSDYATLDVAEMNNID